MAPKRSVVWEHFDKVDEGYIVCKHCKRKFKDPGNTSNMRLHLKRNHPTSLLQPDEELLLKEEQGERVQPRQKEFLIDFMATHNEFAHLRCAGKEGKAKSNEMWRELAAELNKLGPYKDVAKWQRVWIDLKRAIKMKASDVRRQSWLGDGQQSKVGLSLHEEKVLALLHQTAVDKIQVLDNISIDRKVLPFDDSPTAQHSPAQDIGSAQTVEIIIDDAPIFNCIEETHNSSPTLGNLSECEESDVEGPQRKRIRKEILPSEVAKANELTRQVIESLKETNREIRNLNETISQGFTSLISCLNRFSKMPSNQ